MGLHPCVPLIRARDRRCSRDALRTPSHLKRLASSRTTRFCSQPEKFTVILPSLAYDFFARAIAR
jgi:hypothetical protein